METKPLERFATWARRELINAVDAQATAVLAIASVARSERAEVVKKLESQIGRYGRRHVIDKVAYTWFNRIIALRFMDARSYTSAGVVSPPSGQTHGQPEILSDAKRGYLDNDIVTNAHTAGAIIGLLDGTRRSTDAEGEAYALLLTEYCRHWHKPMPFMFEHEGDYTELLVPANLLADGAILARAREVLTEDLCDDVEVIGWLYQFYISERKQAVFDGFNAKGKARKLAGPDEIPAATQLFTPHWIVRYLVENSVGRLWMLNRPKSRLIDQMDYYIVPVEKEAGYLKINKPEELTVLDPACGSGHLLTYAFDLLYAIYEEEGYAPADIPSLILTHNLHGIEIDLRAGALAAFALSMKARARQRTFLNMSVEPNVCVLEPISFNQFEVDFLWSITDGAGVTRSEADIYWRTFAQADVFGSLIRPSAWLTARFRPAIKSALDDDLIAGETLKKARKVLTQAESLTTGFAATVANPPYMGAKNQSATLASWVAEHYPEGKSDLFSAFALRCLGTVREGGQVGLMTPFVWMFITSYEGLRLTVLSGNTLTSLVQLEYSGFEGATVPICAYTVERGHRSNIGAFIRLADFVGSKQQGPRTLEIIEDERALRDLGLPTPRAMENHLYRVRPDDLLKVPGSPLAYWLSDAVRAAFTEGNALREIAEPRVGLQTSNVTRFVRLWSEVGISSLATEEVAGEEARKWFPYNNGGDFRKWYGNQEDVVNWCNNGAEVRAFGTEDGGRPRSRPQNVDFYFRPALAWTAISSGVPGFRLYPPGFIPSNAGMACYGDPETLLNLTGIANSVVAERLLAAMAPTLNFGVGEISRLPVLLPEDTAGHRGLVNALAASARQDWDSYETSWNFTTPSLQPTEGASLSARFFEWSARWREVSSAQNELETENNRQVVEAYGLEKEISIEVPLHRVSLSRNVVFAYGAGRTPDEYAALQRLDAMKELISFAVGCIFGRYSLDEPGLILADQGATLQDYLAKVSNVSFPPDSDNVIPFVGDGWFEDDIVEAFRKFLRVGFGTEHFEENLQFIEESLGVKTLRDYFITKSGASKFYDDHVQRYKKRPIYWMFSSPRGSFNALIYMHRYIPSTASTVLNEYLREFRAKMEVALANAEQATGSSNLAGYQKEADRLRRVLVELAEYEHDVLYPLATQQIEIDLDDGVKVNYPKFYPALKRIAGLEAAE